MLYEIKFNFFSNFNKVYETYSFEGKKHFVISTANAFGGKNMFLSVAYLAVGGVCFLITVGFIVKFII